MKRFILIIGVLFLLSSTCDAQFRKGDIELSFSGSAGSFKSSSTSFGETRSESQGYGLLAIAPSFYLVDGFSAELELGFLAKEDLEPAFFAVGNLSYTFWRTGAKVAPYLRLGYGLSNGFQHPIAGSAVIRQSDKFDINIFNAGVGIKYLLSPGAALRAEINYKSQNWSRETRRFFGGTYKTDYAYSNVGLLLGISVLL